MNRAIPKVSVLVPVYNVERFLPQCLDSLCRQTLRDIEIICINDGSTDGSSSILRSYAGEDPRIRVIEKPNSGYGASMNCGLDSASGEYVSIVESDDYASRGMLAKLYRTATRFDCDLVKSTFFEVYDGRDHWNRYLSGFPFGKRFDPADVPSIICTIPAIWTGLYRRKMLVEEGIRFRETPGAAFQDTSFTLKSWFAASSCVLVRWPYLHYRMDNPNSSVKTSDRAMIVCDELAEAESFLRDRPERLAKFVEWFHADKFGKYRWNYARVSEGLRVAFLERMISEYQRARREGELSEEAFDEQSWSLLAELMEEGAREFFRKHPSAFPPAP
ncbi:glycosyltransferase family 2 protein [Adlercreutzia sp. ZJ242]|uniref:glycosyltransferase family 2 protein n=1 Tax=Adlercreutzia sp. ZJ242 TaxID=2709409 RepID=UPI0013EB8BC2|nr:glycosyltransferase family 2 protein [Adlercreutzia sp. ZJ242]